MDITAGTDRLMDRRQADAAAIREHGAPAPRAAGAADDRAAGVPLGSTQSRCEAEGFAGLDVAPDGLVDRRRARWAARAVLWRASTLPSVRQCGRVIHDRAGDEAVTLRRRAGVGDRPVVAGFGNLTLCGSVWACPRCAAVVAYARSREIGSALRVASARGGAVYLVTLTMRHGPRDRLEDLWLGLSTAWRRAFSGPAWTGGTRMVGDAALFGVAGYVRAVEATWGDPGTGGSGWHLHVHALVVTVAPVGCVVRSDAAAVLGVTAVDPEWVGRCALAGRIAARWSAGLVKRGLSVGAAGVDVRRVTDGGAEHLGAYLSKATYDSAARLGMEVGAGSVTKAGRANRTPFELLHSLVTAVDARGFGFRTPRHWTLERQPDGGFDVTDVDTGEVVTVTPPASWRAWHEWEAASKGRRQVTWSRVKGSPATARERLWAECMAARGATAVASDEEVASSEVGGEALGWVTRAGWYGRLVWRPRWMWEALETAEESPERVSAWMSARGVGYEPR